MAAFRRVAALAGKLNLWTVAKAELVGGQTANGARTRSCLAVGMCVAAGGAAALYFFNETTSVAGRKRMKTHTVKGLFIPTVEAREKVRGSEWAAVKVDAG